MKFEDHFDDNGNWKKPFDPYRDTSVQRALFFNADGNITEDFYGLLCADIKREGLSPTSGFVKAYHAKDIDSFSHGNYTACYAWR